jgi:hypothetical protein
VSTGRELYLETCSPLARYGDEARYANLCIVAECWRQNGNHFSAGYAMSEAMLAAWGCPDGMIEAARSAVSDYDQVISTRPQDSVESIAAVHKLLQLLYQTCKYFEVEQDQIRIRIRELRSELAHRLMQYFRDAKQVDSYLVRGFTIATDLDGAWHLEFPDWEVALGTERFGGDLFLNIPSAFHLFVQDGDWQAAKEVITLRPTAFITPGLRGWRAVTLAQFEPDNAVSRFDEAAGEFAADTMPATPDEQMTRGGS